MTQKGKRNGEGGAKGKQDILSKLVKLKCPH